MHVLARKMTMQLSIRCMTVTLYNKDEQKCIMGCMPVHKVQGLSNTT